MKIIKKSTIIKQLLFLLSMVMVFNSTFAQTTAPKSPGASATGTLKNGTKITIVYSSPSVRDRKIWGALVPMDSVWRAGANAATQIEFDKEVKIDGQKMDSYF